MNKYTTVSIINAIFLIILFYLPVENYIKPYYIIVLITNSIIFLNYISILRSRKNKNQLFIHSLIFLISFIIVHFQFIFEYIISNIDIEEKYIFVDAKYAFKSFVLSSIGLVSFVLGYSLYKEHITTKKNTTPHYEYNLTLLKYIIITILFTFIYYLDPQYIKGYYGQVNAGSIAIYLSSFFEIFIFCYLTLHYTNLRNKKSITLYNYIKSNGLTINFSIIIYLIITLLSGDRGCLIYLTIAYFSVYIFINNKVINLKYMIMFIIASSIFMNILRDIRNLDKDLSLEDKITKSVTTKKEEGKYLISNTTELASSIRSLHYAVKDKNENGITLDKVCFQFHYILLSIPGLFGVYSSYYNIPNHFNSSPDYITWLEQGSYVTYGVGTTCIADIYLDFGLFGTIITFTIFGLLLKHLETYSYNKEKKISIIVTITSLVMISMSVYLGRSPILYTLRIIVPAYLIVKTYIHLNKKTNKITFFV